MIIGIDASTITPSKAGIGYYTYSLLLELSKLQKHEIYAYVNNLNNISEELKNTKINFVEIESDKPNFGWIRKVAEEFERKFNTVFISPSNFAFGLLIKNSLNVVHDLAPVKYKEFFPKKGVLVYNLQLWLLKRRNRQIITSAESVKKELIEYGFKEENVTVILAGVHDWAKEKVSESKLLQVQDRYQLPEKFILSVSTLEPRKNHKTLIKAFAQFSKNNKEYKLVFVGKKGWFYDEIFEEVKKHNLESEIVFAGYVPEEDMAAIIDLSSLVVSISVYEGFALPLIEAGIRGKNLIASDIPIFREVIKDNALYCPPNDVDCITKKIEESINSNRSIDKTYFDQYSWQFTAKQFAEKSENVTGKQ